MKTISYIENLEQWQSEFSFSIPIKVRFSETDMFGHVNNVSPFIYFEEGRIEYLKSIGLFTNLNKGAPIPIVADLQCDYFRQIYFNDTLHLHVKTNHVGKTSFDIHYMALNEQGDICLTGRGRMVNMDPTTGKPVPLEEKMRQKLITT